MAAPFKQDTCIYLREDVTYLLTVYDEDGNLLDLTGSTIRFHVAPSAGATPVITKISTTVTEIEILTQSGETLGQAKIFINPADTASLSAGVYVYDIWVDLVSGEQKLVVAPSRFEILPAVRP
jgi:hypothetical protein